MPSVAMKESIRTFDDQQAVDEPDQRRRPRSVSTIAGHDRDALVDQEPGDEDRAEPELGADREVEGPGRERDHEADREDRGHRLAVDQRFPGVPLEERVRHPEREDRRTSRRRCRCALMLRNDSAPADVMHGRCDLFRRFGRTGPPLREGTHAHRCSRPDELRPRRSALRRAAARRRSRRRASPAPGRRSGPAPWRPRSRPGRRRRRAAALAISS